MVTPNTATLAAQRPRGSGSTASIGTQQHYDGRSSLSAYYHLPIVVLLGLILLQTLYTIVHNAYDRGWTELVGLPQPSSDVCAAQQEQNSSTTDEDNMIKCGRPDLFAFQIASGLLFVVVGCLGGYSWHFGNGPQRQLQPQRNNANSHQQDRMIELAETRLFSSAPFPHAKKIIVLMLIYQIWDFCVSLFIPEYCTVIMMTHHMVAATVAYSALYGQLIGYYGVFYLGVSEISSIFLVSMDLSKYFEPNTWFLLWIDKIAGPCFVVSFVYYRVILWWPVTKQLYDDVLLVFSSSRQQEERKPKEEMLHQRRKWVLYMWLVFVGPMGLLQLYWLTIILDKVRVVIAAE